MKKKPCGPFFMHQAATYQPELGAAKKLVKMGIFLNNLFSIFSKLTYMYY